jgi:hypothetical protein
VNATEERLADALRTVGGTIRPEDVPPPRFTERRRAPSRRPVLLAAAVAASAVVVAGGAVAGGALSSGDEAGRKSGHKAGHETGPVAAAGGMVQVEVDLCTRTTSNASCDGKEVTGAQRAELKRVLEGDRRVREVVYLTKKQAYERFKARTRTPETTGTTGAPETTGPSRRSGDIPEAFIVTVAHADVKGIMQGCLGRPGVDTVFVLRR